MSADDYLQRAAQAMIAAASDDRAVQRILQQSCPRIHRQIVTDRENAALLALWGRSCNVDENAGQVIVDPAILKAIGALAGVPMRGRFLHAGLEHTYGYLFSLIKTTYGFKRDRWVTTDLEHGFGLDPTLLGDRPKAGTLLANLTWFVAQIALRRHPAFQVDEQCAGNVAPELRQYDYARLRVSRIVERTKLGGSDLFLFTDLVAFPRAPTAADRDNTLLIYSIQRGARAFARLITAFPVTGAVVNELLAFPQTKRKIRLRLRYNAYVRGLFGREFLGLRSVLEPGDQN